MPEQRFDAIVIGAGQAGPSLAGRLTAAGMTVALVERHLFGGTCVNTGCMPTKALVASARTAHVARRAADYGIRIEGAVSVDMAAVKARKDGVSTTASGNVEKWLRGMARCTVLRGHARFEQAHTLRIGDEVISAERIFLNVGGRAVVPEIPGLDQVSYLTNTSILELDRVPRHLVIVGGSYIGLEFAQMYRRFGADVTVIERGPHLLPREDPDVSDGIRSILENEGVAIRTGATCIRIAPQGDDIAVGVDCTAGAPEILGSHLLMAVGRRPNTDDLGLERAGIATDARGYVTVDDELRTNVPGIWALGDCNGKGAFTHTAYNDFEIVADNLLGGGSRRVSDRIVTYGLFIDPPLGRVGMTETEARAAGHNIRIGKRPMTRVGRAVEKGETQGFMKVIVDADTDAILGGAILGVDGDEAVHAMLDTMAAKAPYTVLQRAVHIHPTVAELIPTMLGELKP
ncbi:MAG TPA: FAD-containing oxidoreductase [Aliidongia sp.]|uniref:FAD-containing oxidoreductase n=1 Tax=Aliidongia sp. TaxID=1914230 RepID=UPI002DDD31D5|nr:FAD-containing oxidoreductase [Aliidongia sp.]HEV2676357.1 FAD-containing oxidoreductase [Aliidongia sp.]